VVRRAPRDESAVFPAERVLAPFYIVRGLIAAHKLRPRQFQQRSRDDRPMVTTPGRVPLNTSIVFLKSTSALLIGRQAAS